MNYKSLLRIIAMLMITAMLLPAMAGCGDGAGSAATEPATDAPTDPVTDAPTDPVTDAPTDPVTDAPTDPVTDAPTEPVTDAPTEPPVTEPPTPVDPPLTEFNIVEKEAVIDGVVSAYEWNDATRLTLNISDSARWSGNGAGVPGGVTVPAGHTDEDFSVSLSFMVKGDYLYMLEERVDSTPLYTTSNYRAPYASDGTLIWFRKSDTDMCAGIQLNADLSDGSGVAIGCFLEDRLENESTLTTWEAAATKYSGGHFIEVKIPLSEVNLTYNDIKNGLFGVTFCSVNIYNSEFDGDTSKLFGNYGYQIQYTGVKGWSGDYYWAFCPIGTLVAQSTFPSES